jgi:hypothetical protein
MLVEQADGGCFSAAVASASDCRSQGTASRAAAVEEPGPGLGAERRRVRGGEARRWRGPSERSVGRSSQAGAEMVESFAFGMAGIVEERRPVPSRGAGLGRGGLPTPSTRPWPRRRSRRPSRLQGRGVVSSARHAWAGGRGRARNGRSGERPDRRRAARPRRAGRARRRGDGSGAAPAAGGACAASQAASWLGPGGSPPACQTAAIARSRGRGRSVGCRRAGRLRPAPPKRLPTGRRRRRRPRRRPVRGATGIRRTRARPAVAARSKRRGGCGMGVESFSAASSAAGTASGERLGGSLDHRGRRQFDACRHTASRESRTPAGAHWPRTVAAVAASAGSGSSRARRAASTASGHAGLAHGVEQSRADGRFGGGQFGLEWRQHQRVLDRPARAKARRGAASFSSVLTAACQSSSACRAACGQLAASVGAIP